MSTRVALSNLGLAPREIQIYLAIHKYGPLAISEISKKTAIPRVTVYSLLDLLEKREIVIRIKKNLRFIYNVVAPTILFQKEREKLTLLESSLPMFEALAKSNNEDFDIQIYDGMTYSKQAQIDFFESAKANKIKVIQSFSHPDLAKKFPRFLPGMIEKRESSGIQTRLLVSAKQKGEIPKIYGLGKTREVRLFPGHFPFNCTCLVAGHVTLFIITNNIEPKALLIKSNSISSFISACFVQLWESSKVVV